MILSGVFPSLLAGTNAAASVANVVFCSGVAASTNAFLAAANAAFFSVTVCNAAFTTSCVAFGFESTASAAFTASSAACFAVLYNPTVSGVFPAVTSSATTSFSSFLAVSKPPVLALSSSNVAASVNFDFNASTFEISWDASSFAALSVLAFSKSSATLAFVSVNSCWIAATASLYFCTLVGFLFPKLSSLIGVNACSAFLSSAICASVALSFNNALASSNLVSTSVTFSCASNADTLLAFSWAFATSFAAATAVSNSDFNALYLASYALILSWVLPSLLASTNFTLSAANFIFWASVAATTNSALAAFNSANFSFSLLTAAATTSGSGFSWSNIVWAFVWAFIASSFAVLYGSFEIGVLPILGSGSSFINPNKLLFEAVNFDLSVRNACWPSNTAVTISL